MIERVQYDYMIHGLIKDMSDTCHVITRCAGSELYRYTAVH